MWLSPGKTDEQKSSIILLTVTRFALGGTTGYPGLRGGMTIYKAGFSVSQIPFGLQFSVRLVYSFARTTEGKNKYQPFAPKGEQCPPAGGHRCPDHLEETAPPAETPTSWSRLFPSTPRVWRLCRRTEPELPASPLNSALPSTPGGGG